MRFIYSATLQDTGTREVVVSFRDLPECLTSGSDTASALAEAADALEEAIAARITDGEPIPEPSAMQEGGNEYAVAVPRRPRRLWRWHFARAGCRKATLLGGSESMRKWCAGCSIRATAPPRAGSAQRCAR